ncbi:unnamed protein product, partial [Phaeothamnion confervicola]
EPLPPLANLARCLRYLAALEEMRLPVSLETLLQRDALDVARALWRDHQDEPALPPLLCTMLLD